MSNYPAGAAAYLNESDRRETACERAGEHYEAIVLDEIIDDAESFVSDSINTDDEALHERLCAVAPKWAELRKRHEKIAHAQFPIEHAQLEAALQKEVGYRVEDNFHDFY